MDNYSRAFKFAEKEYQLLGKKENQIIKEAYYELANETSNSQNLESGIDTTNFVLPPPIPESKKVKVNENKPSNFALFFAAALQKTEEREFIIADIEERFKEEAKKRGYSWAKWMLWRDNLVGFYSAFGAKIIKGLKWAGLGYLVEKIFLK